MREKGVDYSDLDPLYSNATSILELEKHGPAQRPEAGQGGATAGAAGTASSSDSQAALGRKAGPKR